MSIYDAIRLLGGTLGVAIAAIAITIPTKSAGAEGDAQCVQSGELYQSDLT